MNSNQAIKNGLYAGILCVLYFIGIYLYSESSLEKQLMVHPYVTFSRYLIYLVFMFLSVKNLLKHIKTKELSALIKPGFITFLIANLVFYIFYYLMFKYVDTTLMDASMEYMLDYVPESKPQGVPGKVNPMAEVSNDIRISSTIFAYVREIILGFIFAGILALILRRS